MNLGNPEKVDLTFMSVVIYRKARLIASDKTG